MKHLTVLKDLLESIECPEHHKRPEVINEGDGIKITCCCPKFYNECIFLIHKISLLLAKE